MTRKQIRDKVRKSLGETTSSFWTDSELNQWIEDAIVDIAWRTKCLKTRGTMTTVEDTLEYTLSTYFPKLNNILEVYYDQNGDATTVARLAPVKREDMDAIYPGWKGNDAGTPSTYVYSVEEDYLAIYPKPDSTNAGAYLECHYTYKPTAMAFDSSSPEIPLVLHDAIVERVKIDGYETRGLGDRANNSRQIYMSMISDYQVEKQKDLDEEIIMKSYRNV